MRDYKYISTFLVLLIVTISGGLFAGPAGPGASSYQKESSQTAQPFHQMCGTITTVVGTGEAGFSGDGGPATQATFYHPRGIAFDSVGNLYIADVTNARIRKVSIDGVISTIAGTGGPTGGAGDGGPATQATFGSPYGIAIDSNGNLYITDESVWSVRKVDTQGIITTFLNGVWFRSITVGPDGNLYATAGNGVLKINAQGNTSGIPGQFNFPLGVTVDTEGNVYISDVNDIIQKVNISGTPSTIAGTGEKGFSGDGGPAVQATFARPMGLAVDSEGNLFIADADNHRVRKVDTYGIITTIAGTGDQGFSGDGGPAPLALLNFPTFLAIDSEGNLYIADTENRRIRKVSCVAAPAESDKVPAKKFYEEEQGFVHPSLPPQQRAIPPGIRDQRKAVPLKAAPKWLLPKARVR